MITLDLHPYFRSDRDIDTALRQTLFKAAATGVDTIQIIPGKGTGQLKKRVLAVLAQKHIKKSLRPRGRGSDQRGPDPGPPPLTPPADAPEPEPDTVRWTGPGQNADRPFEVPLPVGPS